MTLLHLYDDRPHGPAGANNLSIARVIKRLCSALKMIHRGIAAAKIHRLRNELMLHAGTSDDWARPRTHADTAGSDVTKYPQRPLVLGDKWDF